MNDLQRTMRAERAVAYLLGRLGLTAYDAGANHAGEPLYYSDLLAHDIAAVQSGDADDATRERLGERWEYAIRGGFAGTILLQGSSGALVRKEMEHASAGSVMLRRRPAGEWEEVK